LQIGAGEPFAGACENLCRGHAKSQRAVANREKPRHLFHQAQAARQLIGADAILHAMLYARDVMILQIRTHLGHILHHLNAQRTQMLGRTDARDLQYMR
jgi:hypothetical protein